MRIDHHDCRTGGWYRYAIIQDGDEYRFRGSFHEVRPAELIVQTFMGSWFRAALRGTPLLHRIEEWQADPRAADHGHVARRRSARDPDKAGEAERELPDEIDADDDEHQSLLQRFGIDPQDLFGNLGKNLGF